MMMKLLVEDNPIKVFEFVKEKLILQGWQSKQFFKFAIMKCAYRGDGGRKCAAGHLIPDSEYKESYENQVLVSMRDVLDPAARTDDHNIPISSWFAEHYPNSYETIQSLQDIHDNQPEGKVFTEEDFKFADPSGWGRR